MRAAEDDDEAAAEEDENDGCCDIERWDPYATPHMQSCVGAIECVTTMPATVSRVTGHLATGGEEAVVVVAAGAVTDTGLYRTWLWDVGGEKTVPARRNMLMRGAEGPVALEEADAAADASMLAILRPFGPGAACLCCC